jgi:hypothetical protein
MVETPIIMMEGSSCPTLPIYLSSNRYIRPNGVVKEAHWRKAMGPAMAQSDYAKLALYFP